MTALLSKAFAEATQLSEEQQNQLAQMILDIMSDDSRWDELFASSQDLLADMANEAIAEYQAGNTKPCRSEMPQYLTRPKNSGNYMPPSLNP